MGTWSKPVVVGYAASSESEFALQWAVQVAQRRGLPLTVVHATGVEPSSVELARPGILQMYQQRAQKVAEQGARHARGLAPVAVSAAGLQGGAAAALVEQSEQASLVVLGHRTRGVLTEAIVGSVALAVVTHAACPVAVVRQSPAPLPSAQHPVVVGIDGSEHSTRALDEAALLAADTRSFLRIVTAWQRPDQDLWSAYYNARSAASGQPQDASGPDEDAWSAYHRVREQLSEKPGEADSYESLLAQASQHAAETARQAAQRVRERYPDLKVETTVSEGSAALAILKAAAGASLIAVGARGHGGLKALLLGSVSRKVMNQAECAVYVIR